MKTNLLVTYVLLISAFFGYANTDKYRIMISDDPSSTITIGWNQVSGTAPIVYYDTVDHGTNHLLYNNSKTVDRAIVHKSMDNRFVRLTGLSPNTNYYFIIKDSDSTSARFWFRTAPNDLSRLSFIAGGDSRNNSIPRQNANTLVSKLKPHAVLFGGDMTDSNSSAQWQEWFDDWQLTIASDGRMFPILATRGNHETDATTVYNLFDTTNSDSYYAVTFGDDLIRAYTLNTEISVLGNQKTWLENDLNTASPNLKWKMAQYHKPMRPHTAWKSENNNEYDAWADLFYNNGVRLVVECDSHMAKTTWPVKPSFGPENDEGFVVEQVNGTVYTGEGCWGAPLRPNDDDKTWTRNSGSFNQFKLIFVDALKIELRTIDVNNASLVGSVSNTDPFTLPANLNVFTPATGGVVTISNVPDSSCPPTGVACDDNDPTTINDEEDGNCNCIGFDQLTLSVDTHPIGTSSDDAEEFISTGAVNLTSSDLEFVTDLDNASPEQQIVGLRFDNINIPKGATILRAYIQFQTDELDSDPTSLVFHGELADASSTFTTTTNNISSRTLTSISVPWNNINEWDDYQEQDLDQRSPYLETIVSEIITQPGWQMGNAVTFIVSGTGRRVADSRNGDVNGAPTLKVFYYSNCPITTITPGTQGACNDSNDTYSQDLIVEYVDPPTTGTLVVNGQSFAIGTSPQTVTLTGLTADGLDVDVIAAFSDEDCDYVKESLFEAPSKCSLGGLPDNVPDDNLNLALLPEATLYGTAVNGRGTPGVILYNPAINNYQTVTSYNEYGVSFGENLGKPGVEDGFKWQVNWPNVKYFNYLTIGGAYPNQPQPNTMWIISHRKDGVWTTLASGQGGWIDDGIFEWGGTGFNPIEADALRVQIYSDGTHNLESIHLRGRGGISGSVNDNTTTPKATLIQYLSPGNSCGVTVPTNSILFCGGSWIYSDGPDEFSGTENIIIADGTYTIDTDIDVEVNDLEILSGATVIIKEGASLTINGDLTNNGSLELESISTKYSSLIIKGSSTGNVIYKRHVNNASGTGTTTGNNDLISAPVTGQTFGNFRATNSNILSGTIGGNLAFLFGPFNTTNASYTNYSASDDSSILSPGIGYRSGSTDNSTYTFDGIVQTGTVNIPVVAGGASDWNLIGNPYPSYIKAQILLSDLINSGLIDTNAFGIYGYDGAASDGWIIYNLANTSPSTIIAPGQGFFVNAATSGNISVNGDILTNGDMRVKGSGDDFIATRDANVLTYLKLNSSTNNKSYHTDFYFNSNASLGLDPGYDAAIWNEIPPSFAIYSHLVENNTGVAMALQTLNDNDLSNVVIPIGVNAIANESLTFSVLESTLPSFTNIYLEDTFTNTITLLNTSDYSFTPLNNISGTGRFYLRIETDALSLNQQPFDGISIYTNATEKTVVIEGQLQSNTNFELYDINGRLLTNTTLNSNETKHSIDVAQLSAGIYIVKLVSETDEKRIKKLIIY